MGYYPEFGESFEDVWTHKRGDIPIKTVGELNPDGSGLMRWAVYQGASYGLESRPFDIELRFINGSGIISNMGVRTRYVPGMVVKINHDTPWGLIQVDTNTVVEQFSGPRTDGAPNRNAQVYAFVAAIEKLLRP